MLFNLKNNVIEILLVGVLLVSSLALLSHHTVPLSNGIDSSNCKTACFTESASNQAIALPEKLNSLLVVMLPLLTSAIIYVCGRLFINSCFAYLHNIGPPIYKRLAVYRI